MLELKDIIELLEKRNYENIYININNKTNCESIQNLKEKYTKRPIYLIKFEQHKDKIVLKLKAILNENNFDYLHEEYINNIIDHYIKPLNLHENPIYKKWNDNCPTSFDIVQKLKDKTSQEYKNIYNIKPDRDYYNFDNTIIYNILLEYFKNIIEKMKQNYPYLFHIKMELSTDDYNVIIYEYLWSQSKDALKSYIYDYIHENYDYYYFDNRDYCVDNILKNINFSDITNKPPFEDFPNLKDDLFEELRYMIEENTVDDFINLKNYNAYMNLLPKQDGNDEGDDLNTCLDDIKNKNQTKNPMMEWLFESQGYKISDLFDKNKIKNSIFLKSFLDELDNFESNSCAFFTFLVKINSDDIEHIKNNKRFIIPQNVCCGLVNIVHGSGSMLDVKLEKPIELSFDFSNELYQLETNDNKLNTYGYNVNDIYDLVKSVYKPITIQQKEIDK